MTRFLLFTYINGCRVGSGCACLIVCVWFEWPSSGVVGFEGHESPWCISLWLCNCVWLRLVGCRPDPCTWWKTWLLNYRCSWPSMGYYFIEPMRNSDHSSLPAGISMVQAAKLVLVATFCENIKLIIIQFVVQYRICPGVTFFLLTFLLRFERTSVLASCTSCTNQG